MAYEQIVSVTSAATSGQVPTADGTGGFAWTTPQSGGGEYIVDELVNETLTQEVSSVTVNLTGGYSYKELYAYIEHRGTSTNTNIYEILVKVNNTAAMQSTNIVFDFPAPPTAKTDDSLNCLYGFSKILPSGCIYDTGTTNSSSVKKIVDTLRGYNTQITDETAFNLIHIQTMNGWGKFGVNTVIKIWGVRA